MAEDAFIMEKGWKEVLREEFDQPYMKQLQAFLAREIQEGHTIYPPGHLIFNALCQTPFDEVKVVIVGQDPYHGEGQAHGHDDSETKGVNPSPPLQNIFKEIVEDVKISMAQQGNLLSWAKQGILLSIERLRSERQSPNPIMERIKFYSHIIERLVLKKNPIVFGENQLKKVRTRFSKKNHTIL